MRYILAITLAVVFAATGTAFAGEKPIDGGCVLAEGNLMITSYSGDAYGTKGYTVFEASTTLGVFVVDHVLAGLSTSLYEVSRASMSENYLIGPTVGFYLDPTPDRRNREGSLYPYARLFYMVGGISEYLGDSQSRYGARVGAVAMLSHSIGFDMAVQYSHDEIQGVTSYTYVYESPGVLVLPDGPDVSGNTFRFGIGLTGFIF